MTLSLLFFIIFAGTFLFGKVIEKFHIPSIFASLFIGVVFSFIHIFPVAVSSETLSYFSLLGMYLLLFLIGLEIDLEKLKKNSTFILRSALFIIGLEGIFGSLLIHTLFSYSWPISFLVGISFATVGEAVLIPILEKFTMLNTKLGQTIIGIGTVDDVIEVFALIIMALMIGAGTSASPVITLLILFTLIIAPIILSKLSPLEKSFEKGTSIHFFAVLIIFFLLVGIGEFAELSSIGALFAGFSVNALYVKNKKKKKHLNLFVKTLTFAFFGPIFFFEIGSQFQTEVFLKNPLNLLWIILVIVIAKFIGTWISTRKTLGTKGSIILATGLLVKFSTGIIIAKILFSLNIIQEDLYSMLIAASIFFVIVIPIVFSILTVKWKKAIV